MSLDLSGVTVSYTGADVVRGVDLTVGTGERFAIMGPSGSGKTTLLRAIAGLTPITSGSIFIDGQDRTTTPAHKRSVGLMFQDYALFPHMTVLENVTYGLRMVGVVSQKRNVIGRELLDLVGLSGFADRRPPTLSGGEQQRVALARTLAPSPSVVLLDEPLGSLDVSLRESLLAETRSILDSVGATSVYVTHDRGEAFAFCDRMAILRDGSIVRVGTPDEIWHDPQSLFTARSIGQSNLVSIGMLDRTRSGTAFVPLGAITIHPDGQFAGVVVTSRFDDGSHIATVVVTGRETRLDIPVARSLAPGTDIRFDIDLDDTIVVSTDEI